MLMSWDKHRAVMLLLGLDDFEPNETVCLKYVHKAPQQDGLRRIIMGRKGWDERQVMKMYAVYEEEVALYEAEFRANCLKRQAEN